MTPRPAPRRSTPTARPAPQPAASRWSAANPVDDLVDEPDPPAPRARTAPAPNRPRAPRPAPGGAPPTVGLGAARTDRTGKPRVDWPAYDAQIYDTEPEWVLYRAWTRLPVDGRWWARWWQHLLAYLLGPTCRLLWVGISMRAGIARATEHLADKSWRRLIHTFEIDPHAGDAGPPGARYFTTERAAELYEDGRIAAECPQFNTRGNDRAYNPAATHLTKRIQTRHRADWQQQAGALALVWLVVSLVFAVLLWPEVDPAATGFAGWADRVATGSATGIGAGAVAMMVWRIGRLAIVGAQPTTAQKARLARRR